MKTIVRTIVYSFIMVITCFAEPSDMFTEEVYSDVQLERAMEKIQFDFEKSLDTRSYIAPWVATCTAGASVIAALIYCTDRVMSEDSLSKDIAVRLCSAIPAAGVFYVGSYWSARITADRACSIGKKYNLLAEQCFYILIQSASFQDLFIDHSFYYEGFISIPAYYKNAQEFIDQYNNYLLQQ